MLQIAKSHKLIDFSLTVILGLAYGAFMFRMFMWLISGEDVTTIQP